jgi:hypothetical protein
MDTKVKTSLDSFLGGLGVLCGESVPVFALLVAVTVSSGCLVVSLQPAYDDQSVVFDEALLGQWENAEDGERATIERGEWRSYRITYVDRTATRIFQGNLTKIGITLLLDVTEMRGADPGPLLVPVHGLIRVTIAGDTLTAARLNYDRFIRARTQKAIGLPPSAVDDRRNAVITEPTRELRRWLLKIPADEFTATATFTRR